ncbi:MAG: type VI secretion system contractile sheath large subunit, partial [Polyangiales bacterium]
MSEQAQGSGAAATTTEGSLLDDILSETKLAPSDEGYEVAKRGVQAFIAQLLTPTHVNEKVDKAFADSLIAEIDAKLSKQLDQIIHNPAFQKLESAWRGLKFVIDRVDFRENVKVEVLNCSKEDLATDFEDAPEITKSGLYRIAYTAEYGQFGGKPYGSMFANFDFGPGPQDVALLASCASVAAMSHAPFFAAAGPGFLGEKSFLNLPNLKDIKSIFEGPQYTKWQSFRESEDARYVGLLMPRFLLRLPYGETTVPVKSFAVRRSMIFVLIMRIRFAVL